MFKWWFKRETPAERDKQQREIAAGLFVKQALMADPTSELKFVYTFINCTINGKSVGDWEITVEPL